MHERYTNQRIESIWSDKHKLDLWQESELAAARGWAILGKARHVDCDQMRAILTKTPIDIVWWKKRDKKIHHDLNAFLDERLRHLPAELHELLHRGLTSFDTIEAAFARMLIESLAVIDEMYDKTTFTVEALARKYRFTIMNGRTHGQEAELQSFGKRCLTWLVDLRVAYDTLQDARKRLKYSKISGAIGNYGDLDPQLEIEALRILGFEPFYGATQIMPRVLYQPIADALSNLTQVLGKIALDIRLGARSGRPILREPFGKSQVGSSAMPQKRNTIRTENVTGMARMARKFAGMIRENISTWEERAIEQSSVERVAWPDLFHVTASALSTMSGVLEGLNVYPDNMLREIHESRGTYGAGAAKEFLKMRMAKFGLEYEDAYRIIQLACFIVFEPSPEILKIRETTPTSFQESAALLQKLSELSPEEVVSIRELVPRAGLRVSRELNISRRKVSMYNRCLRAIFAEEGALQEWEKCFDPAYLLRNEDFLYRKILGAQ